MTHFWFPSPHPPPFISISSRNGFRRMELTFPAGADVSCAGRASSQRPDLLSARFRAPANRKQSLPPPSAKRRIIRPVPHSIRNRSPKNPYKPQPSHPIQYYSTSNLTDERINATRIILRQFGNRIDYAQAHGFVNRLLFQFSGLFRVCFGFVLNARSTFLYYSYCPKCQSRLNVIVW